MDAMQQLARTEASTLYLPEPWRLGCGLNLIEHTEKFGFWNLHKNAEASADNNCRIAVWTSAAAVLGNSVRM